jgi:hypothetical protein
LGFGTEVFARSVVGEMALFRQLTPDRGLGLVVDFLHVDKSLVWPGGCHAKDFPLAFKDGSDYGSEQTGEVENLLEFLPLFAEVDGVRILRALLKHVTQCASPPTDGANYRGVWAVLAGGLREN